MEIREFATYTDMQVAHQKDVSAFPMTYSFGRKSDEEMKEILGKIGATCLAECVSLYGAGDIMQKEDVPKWKELCKQHAQERELFAQKEEKLVEMILSEMYNHEYGYTCDPGDTLSALGKTKVAFENELFNRAWKKAEQKCFEPINEHEEEEEEYAD